MLRHTFGSLAIRKASLVDVQTWMGHADVKTTMRYLHHRPRGDEARLLGAAFRVEEPASGLQANGFHKPAETFQSEAAAEVESPAQPALSRNGEEPPGSP
jgi:hypothetical protein